MLTNEDLLHFIWKYKLFNSVNLTTTQQEHIRVVSYGTHNLDAGPDFTNVQIEIDGTLWAGNIEIHIKASDWFRHHHQTDRSYDSVILHVVWEADMQVERSDGTIIPTLVLNDRVNLAILKRYEQLKQNIYWIPCEKQLPSVDDFTKAQCLDRVLIYRLEEKSKYLQSLYYKLNKNWEDTFYVSLAKCFGFKVNGLPFEVLSINLPQKILAKHKNNPLQIDALIFGMSGFLTNKFKEDYPNRLKNEFQFLKHKYNLQPAAPEIWKFSKTRPDNFPTIRLAQFSALIISVEHLFSKVLSLKTIQSFFDLFHNLPINNYWETHYRFDVPIAKKSSNIGKSSIQNLIINGISPLLFYYGKEMGRKDLMEISIELLERMPAEVNKISKGFEIRGLKATTAFDSQALIYLKNYFCDAKKCLNCGIGIKIVGERN